jgi:hypothetical protein
MLQYLPSVVGTACVLVAGRHVMKVAAPSRCGSDRGQTSQELDTTMTALLECLQISVGGVENDITTGNSTVSSPGLTEPPKHLLLAITGMLTTRQ